MHIKAKSLQHRSGPFDGVDLSGAVDAGRACWKRESAGNGNNDTRIEQRWPISATMVVSLIKTCKKREHEPYLVSLPFPIQHAPR